MPEEYGDDPDPWERHLAAPLAGRKIIASFELLAGLTGLVDRLRSWGAQRPLLLADGRGTGPVPDPAAVELIMLDMPEFETLTDQVRARMRPEERLTPEVVAAVERYDPEQSAAWWVSPVGLNTPLLDRPVFGGRPPQQAELEDKMVVDQLLDAIAAPRCPAVITTSTYDELMTATQQVLEQSGVDHVVWAGDAAHGVNGGGDFVRWVRSDEQASTAAEFFGARCDRVRVSPFLEGVPCSIHGIVLRDGVVVLRPVELAILRDCDTGRFVTGGLGTTWDPPASDAEEMRSVARRLGEFLSKRMGYRGAFGLDGVLTTDGFRVTELNARFSGGLTRLGRAAPAAQLELVHVNALIDRDVARPAAEIEAHALTLLDDNRFTDVMGLSRAAVVDEQLEVTVGAGASGLDVTNAEEGVIGHVLAGPSPLGTFFRLVTLEGIVGRGERVAPLSVLLLDFADRTWGAGFDTPLMAPDVRRSA